jgi:iron(III) transport system ATP-binding protein
MACNLQLKNFGIQFDNRTILENISLSVKPGEIVTLLGQSGCGKSTILRSIAGLETKHSGEILINGICVSSKDSFIDVKQRKSGYIFQDYALFPHLNVEENIGFALDNISKKDKKNKISKLLEQFEIKQYAKSYIYQLSGGQQQRVAIARVLAYEPKLLLLDEPFSNLDSILKNKTISWIKKLIKTSNISAILVTHDKKEALSISDKIGIIHNNNILQFGRPQELFNRPNSLYIANFLSDINIIPNSLYKKLNIKIDNNQIAIIRVDKTNIKNIKNSIELNIKDISYCGEYYEISLVYKDYSNYEVLVRINTIETLKVKQNMFLDISYENILFVNK